MKPPKKFGGKFTEENGKESGKYYNMGNALHNAVLHNFNFALVSGKELLVNLFL